MPLEEKTNEAEETCEEVILDLENKLNLPQKIKISLSCQKDQDTGRTEIHLGNKFIGSFKNPEEAKHAYQTIKQAIKDRNYTIGLDESSLALTIQFGYDA